MKFLIGVLITVDLVFTMLIAFFLSKFISDLYKTVFTLWWYQVWQMIKHTVQESWVSNQWTSASQPQ